MVKASANCQIMKAGSNSIAILGAGITGLSAAWSLTQKGAPVTLYEKETHAGGVIQSHQSDGWLVESGPNTMLVNKQQIWDLLDELDLHNAITKPESEAKKRYIVRNQVPQAVPMSAMGFLKTNLFSASAKFRLLKEPFITAARVDDESIARFVRRRLGTEPLNYGVNPFVSGIYAGDPKELSIKHTFRSLFQMEQKHGSITKGFIKRKKKNDKPKRALISFYNGLQTLPKALASPLGNSLKCNTPVKQIRKTATGWRVKTPNTSAEHPALLSTIPVHQLPNIWSDKKSRHAVQQLAGIPYAPMSVLALGFKRSQISHPLDGFGMLVPERESYSMLGCLFSSSLFPNRSPENHALLTCFIGGARRSKLASSTTESLIRMILPELVELLGVEGSPVFHYHTCWPKAIPQYTVGYDTSLKTMRQVEKAHPGFFLAGNFRHGVSVPDCIINGLEIAENLYHYHKNAG